MITRVSDYNDFSNDQMEKLAKIVEKRENKSLIEIVDNENQVNVIKKELKIQGYETKVEPLGDKWKVFAITPDKVKYEEAVASGMFKKLAWGRYSFQKESAFGAFNYEFDDGSIWRTMTAEDGKEYLVKEVDDENEDDVVRVKLASNQKESLANDNNVKTIISILYDIKDNQLIEDLLKSNIKDQLYSILNNKLATRIDDVISNNHFIQSANYKKDVCSLVLTGINSKEITSSSQLNKLIVDHTNTIVKKTSAIEKLFN
jgi:hypothetical protein